MLKNILNTEGAQKLSKEELKHINGGAVQHCFKDSDCGSPNVCIVPNSDIYLCGPDRQCQIWRCPL